MISCQSCKYCVKLRRNGEDEYMCGCPDSEYEGTEAPGVCEEWATSPVTDLRCRDPRACFARKDGCCTVLRETYEHEKRACPFCKPERDVTKGKRYEHKIQKGVRLVGRDL